MSHSNEEELNPATTSAINDAVGEKLSHDLQPDNSQRPPGLQTLMTELRRQDK